MPHELDLNDFQSLVERIGATLIVEVSAKLSDKKWKLKNNKWKSAFVDSRWTTDGNTRIAKVRVILPDDRVFSRIRTPNETADLLDQIGDMKDRVFPDKWYGLTLTVLPSGKCEVKFDYDPNCSVDPRFFDPD